MYPQIKTSEDIKRVLKSAYPDLKLWQSMLVMFGPSPYNEPAHYQHEVNQNMADYVDVLVETEDEMLEQYNIAPETYESFLPDWVLRMGDEINRDKSDTPRNPAMNYGHDDDHFIGGETYATPKKEDYDKVITTPLPASTPTVMIDPQALAKVQYWVEECPQEVGGMGKLIRTKDNALLVTEAYLLEQQVTYSDFEIEADAMAKLMHETIKVPGQMMFWWHSHVNMDVFWSSTDTETIRTIGDEGMLLSTVFNKRGESRTALYIGSPKNSVRPDIFIDDMELLVRCNPDTLDTVALKKEFDEKVKLSKGYGVYGGKYDGYNNREYWKELDRAIQLKENLKKKKKIRVKNKGVNNVKQISETTGHPSTK